MKQLFFWLLLFLAGIDTVFAQQDKTEVFTSVSYEQYIIFQNLAIFWLAIIGLLIIIRMKLKEIERVQKMGIYNEDKDIPLLD